MPISEEKKVFLILLVNIFIVIIITATIASIVLVPRIENISIFNDLTLATENLAKENIKFSKEIEELRGEKEKITTRTVSKEKQKEVKILEERVGIREIDGDGVIITINDHPNIQKNISGNNATCHGSNIRDVINILRFKELEVEGISINGNRIHIQTSINCFADGISIDTNKIFAPYEIKVIGKTEKILNNLKNQSLAPQLWNSITKEIIEMQITKEEDVTLPFIFSPPQTTYFFTTQDEENSSKNK